jgi:predicted RNA-binding Zn ribbon-like protein
METARVEEMLLAGGHPALDFVNTLGGASFLPPDEWPEHLRRYRDLLTFGVRTGTISEETAAALDRIARKDPSEADAALAAALELRSLIDHAFRPLAAGSPPGDNVLRALRNADGTALRRAALVPGDAGYRWSWGHSRELEAPLWPLAHGAVELLTSPDLEQVKLCKRCRWLFLDVSKNHSRRWCSMEGCGTDAKKERYTERRRAKRAQAKA